MSTQAPIKREFRTKSPLYLQGARLVTGRHLVAITDACINLVSIAVDLERSSRSIPYERVDVIGWEAPDAEVHASLLRKDVGETVGGIAAAVSEIMRMVSEDAALPHDDGIRGPSAVGSIWEDGSRVYSADVIDHICVTCSNLFNDASELAMLPEAIGRKIETITDPLEGWRNEEERDESIGRDLRLHAARIVEDASDLLLTLVSGEKPR